MKSKSLRMALEKFNEAKQENTSAEGQENSSEEGFEVMNLDEASSVRGGLVDCTCRGSSSTYTAPKCTCDAGASYSA